MFCVCNLQKRGGVYNIHKLLEIGENTWWTNLPLSLFDQGCIWRLWKARLHHTFKLKITPGFTLSDVSHMHHMHECMVLVAVSKNDKYEGFNSHLTLSIWQKVSKSSLMLPTTYISPWSSFVKLSHLFISNIDLVFELGKAFIRTLLFGTEG